VSTHESALTPERLALLDSIERERELARAAQHRPARLEAEKQTAGIQAQLDRDIPAKRTQLEEIQAKRAALRARDRELELEERRTFAEMAAVGIGGTHAIDRAEAVLLTTYHPAIDRAIDEEDRLLEADRRRAPSVSVREERNRFTGTVTHTRWSDGPALLARIQARRQAIADLHGLKLRDVGDVAAAIQEIRSRVPATLELSEVVIEKLSREEQREREIIARQREAREQMEQREAAGRAARGLGDPAE
jgi:hypothetical protein